MAISETYTLGDFHSTLSEACSLMGELYYVDKVLDHLKGEEFEGPTNPQIQSSEVTVEIGWTHRFSKSVLLQGAATTHGLWIREVEGLMSGWAEEGAAWGESVRGWVLDHTGDLTSVFRAEFDVLIEGTADVNNSLAHDGAEDFGGLGENLGVWKGRARDSFVNDWYKPFVDIRSNHCFVLRQLSSCLSVAAGATSSAQHALMNVVSGAKKAADDQLRKRQADNREESSTAEVLGLASSITGLMGAVTFWNPPATATFSIISATTGLAASAIEDTAAEPVDVKGASAQDLEQSLDQHVRDTVSNWDQMLVQLDAEVVTELAGFVDAKDDDLRLYPRRPGIGPNPDPDQFHHESSTQY